MRRASTGRHCDRKVDVGVFRRARESVRVRMGMRVRMSVRMRMFSWGRRVTFVIRVSVGLDVLSSIRTTSERFTASRYFAVVGFDTLMRSLMTSPVRVSRKSTLTSVAFIGLLTSVCPLVSNKVSSACKLLGTILLVLRCQVPARIRSVTRMKSLMATEIGQLREEFRTI